ncbi:D-glycero-alpha-D-manno-heptose-7-phosphate kinase [Desulfobotulus alkaliphilus]|uniref:D-glycero-alpha-D-manno-heptose-7-phosphate kinase n=1 Tax=Desulfobotulus alkaliphilus TaxID=622671 RepID=A0A562RZI8_9BACT|nr:galactokinase [Desulfobotulus alkaliphilus]TWI74378.1 D-glycero-alpha-D-manno-heptose-7-phosphate kinase [Desulfobotulus alkaliphilus]
MDYWIPEKEILASAPCRIDFGGTLDLPLFYYSLGPALACTLNIALNLRTTVKIKPYKKGRVRVVSRGFSFAEFPCGRAPYRHPLGLVFAILDAFGARDIFVEIHSASPPRSALGGSSVMAVALIALLMKIKGKNAGVNKKDVVILAKNMESAVAGVPCGMQDHLAAAFGGMNLWHWDGGNLKQPWKQSPLMAGKENGNLSSRMLVAYGGEPHDSLDVNGRWVQGFAEGKTRMEWEDIAMLTRRFGEALAAMDLETAIACMEEELAIRLRLTPDVLDPAGMRLASAAGNLGCGVRFAGAGGGGCIWALGPEDKIDVLRNHWQRLMETMPGAFILDAVPEKDGVLFDV